jgi:solute:Na+ symporter, SSS family
MTLLDWAVLAGALATIVGYGVWRTREAVSSANYLGGERHDRWHTIGLSVMATQASAITFLSTPGQAYEHGMGFVQFYFGLPLAMIVLSAVVVPRYYRLRVQTAYEFLEQRFDLKVRQLAAFLFLVQRGLSAGVTLYAPAIILSKVLGWSLDLTVVATGGVVILYTVSGGSRAVSQTQKLQILVMMGGFAAIFAWLLWALPPQVSLSDALHIAGAMGNMEAVDFSFDPASRYTLWSGLAGGFFLAMAYFGTDQSQVQRYLSGRSLTDSRLGLLFNGLFKVPMQFFILLVGILVLVLHQFDRPPLFFNQAEWDRVQQTTRANEARRLEAAHAQIFQHKRQAALDLESALATADAPRRESARARLRQGAEEARLLRRQASALVAAALPRSEPIDTDYIFLAVVVDRLPRGLIGLLLAVILCAAMSSSSAELSALSSTTVVDFYRRSFRRGRSDRHYLTIARVFTVSWGILALAFAVYAALIDNLIQAVNILGSLFYGTILGMFLLAFSTRSLRAGSVFTGALLSEAVVIACFVWTELGFLWFNVIGCGLVIAFSNIIDVLRPRRSAPLHGERRDPHTNVSQKPPFEPA